MQSHLSVENEDVNLDDILFNYLAKLSLAEKQLLKIMIRNKSDSSLVVVMTIKEYAEEQNIIESDIVDEIMLVVSSFFNRYIKIPNLDFLTKDVVTSRWIDSYNINDDKETVYLGFSQPFNSLLTKIGADKASNMLEFLIKKPVSDLENIYSVHFYKYLDSIDDETQKIEFEYDEFRKILKVEEEKYTTIQNFKLRVLHPVVLEMNKKVGLNIKYEDVRAKSGSSKITGFCFLIGK